MADWKFSHSSIYFPYMGDYNINANRIFEHHPYFNNHIHPLFIKLLTPIRQGYSNVDAAVFYYDYCNLECPLTREQSGFNPIPIPAWTQVGQEHYLKNDSNGLLNMLEGDTESYFSKISFFLPTETSLVTSNSPVFCFKPTGYGSTSNVPKTSYSGAKIKKIEWKSIVVGPCDSYDELAETLENRLNSPQLKNLHPLQIKVTTYAHSNVKNSNYAIIYYTEDYANAAPNTFVIKEGKDAGNMVLPYAMNYLNAYGKVFNKWLWVQVPFKKGLNFSIFKINSPSDMIIMLGKLTPAQQFLAHIEGSGEISPKENKYTSYLTYPLAYYEGYKKLPHNYNPKSYVPSGTSVPFQLLNMTGEELDVYGVNNNNNNKDGWKIGQLPISNPNNLGLLDLWHIRQNTVFKFTEKGNSNAVVGIYQMVPMPDYQYGYNINYTITIIIEQKNTLYTNESFGIGGWLKSDNLRYKLNLAEDSLCIYTSDDDLVWYSDPYNFRFKPKHLIMQSDGNLCLYDTDNICRWDSYSDSKKSYKLGPNYKAVLTNEGKLTVVNAEGITVWTT